MPQQFKVVFRRIPGNISKDESRERFFAEFEADINAYLNQGWRVINAEWNPNPGLMGFVAFLVHDT
nr:hypothetical protein [Candidatus Sigynarchaeota archaeon]